MTKTNMVTAVLISLNVVLTTVNVAISVSDDREEQRRQRRHELTVAALHYLRGRQINYKDPTTEVTAHTALSIADLILYKAEHGEAVPENEAGAK